MTTMFPSGSPRVRRDFFFLVMVFAGATAPAQAQFVARSNDTLMLSGKPFYSLGANAYYLLEQAARNDTTTVNALFAAASGTGMTVVRTWGFFDSSDSANQAVIQFRPGAFNEHALRALDFVVYKARLHGVRLLIPFVNSWDDYGGMNQYVRWRSEIPADEKAARYSEADRERRVAGDERRSYRYALTANWGHDDFYADPTIRSWFKFYVAAILNRINTYTNIAYKDEPAIFGWELANEPRSSDFSALLVSRWISEMSDFVKSIDANHLLGTGEEGFDVSARMYSSGAYNNQSWLFNGSMGTSFTANSSVTAIDFGSCHLYPESWNVSVNAGNVWIRDHVRIARAIRKPLVLGEFAVRVQKRATYASWLTTVLLDGAAGAAVWQLLEGPRTDHEGYGFRCSTDAQLCTSLQEAADKFKAKSINISLPIPSGFSLSQNFPNPFNDLTTISYSLPFESHVELAVFNTAGQRVTTIVDGIQSAGVRSELLDVKDLASGVYFYRFTGSRSDEHLNHLFVAAKKLVLVR
ncbi:MAG: T9SS type A sorting domain-containing protein [Ignavibacteriae bacterium]|nr:T9SS type A sorting domain-containing protein [Ignavibacteriota bacterium]